MDKKRIRRILTAKRLISLAATLLCLATARAVAVEDIWRYTTKDPGKGWQQPGAKEGPAWKTGKAGFGKHGTPGGRVRSIWRTPDIWMRREAVVGKATDISKLSLEICHDEDFEVYLNGVLAARAAGHIKEYKIFAIAPEARCSLKSGKNLIAVHCHQTRGGQFIDVALTTRTRPRPPTRKAPARPAPRPAVDPRYVRKATWPQSMLAARQALRDGGVKIDLGVGSALAARMWRDWPHQTDWLMQDSPVAMANWVPGERDGKGDLTNFLKIGRDASLERKLIERVLPECGPARPALQKRLGALVDAGVGPEDPRWLALYVRACRVRRHGRLEPLLAKTGRIVFAKHHNMGGGFFAYTEYTSWGGNRFGGLCRIDLANERAPDGPFAAVSELIETDTGGIIRDPALSYDAKRLLFAWRADKSDRYYKIHEMDLSTGKTRLITGADTYGASYEPCYLPDGNILFVSSRVVQSVDCAGPDVSNFFVCDADGKRVRRVGFDQVHTLWPAVLDDGRVVYMRWDYNDRSQIYTQGLLQMNPDGTGQMEFYGNNTWEPTTFFHPRGIPGTSKVVVALGGHHNPQCGKLAVVDNSKARQGLDGVTELPSGRVPTYRRADRYAQTGDQYCYPFPLDDSSLLVSYDPIGYHIHGGGRRLDNKAAMRFHVYFMTFDGKREVLSADTRISSCQPIPIIARTPPPPRATGLDYRKTTGTFYLQDVYHGPGLKGISRGTIKKLRVVAIRYREMNIGANGSSGKGGGARVVTPIAIGTGAWDVKAILGDATVQADGSAFFEVPARTPVYFQALNAKNQTIQTMRSWATLMPGEQMSCVGCHEDPNSVPLSGGKVTLALAAGAQKLEPFHAPARGFSFPKEIQPILDKHCVRCHRAGGKSGKVPLTAEPVHDPRAKRNWSRAYVTLTRAKDSRGKSNEIVNWISNSSEPCMIPPRYGGSTRSKLIAMHEKGHQKVKLSRQELDKLAAWIDLVVPFCGDYVEANAWTERERQVARERIELRKKMDALELQAVRELAGN